jgi:hypothetical protein
MNNRARESALALIGPPRGRFSPIADKRSMAFLTHNHRPRCEGAMQHGLSITRAPRHVQLLDQAALRQQPRASDCRKPE